MWNNRKICTSIYVSLSISLPPSLLPYLSLPLIPGVGVCTQSLGGVKLFCDPMDCSPFGSSVHGIFPARIQEWVAISSSRRSSQPRDWTRVSGVSCIGAWILCHWATCEAWCSSPLTVVLSRLIGTPFVLIFGLWHGGSWHRAPNPLEISWVIVTSFVLLRWLQVALFHSWMGASHQEV